MGQEEAPEAAPEADPVEGLVGDLEEALEEALEEVHEVDEVAAADAGDLYRLKRKKAIKNRKASRVTFSCCLLNKRSGQSNDGCDIRRARSSSQMSEIFARIPSLLVFMGLQIHIHDMADLRMVTHQESAKLIVISDVNWAHAHPTFQSQADPRSITHQKRF